MNIIDAICTLSKITDFNIISNNNGKNRANNAGDALEIFIKNVFANSLNCSEKERLKLISDTFSYIGNNSNPPDAMLKNGDAMEIKKIESDNSALALNSSYPKSKLKANSSMISMACRNAEKWDEKDLIYIVGVVKSEKLKSLAFVYGMDYCADEECYLRIKNTIKDGVENIQGIEFTETRELGHINKVDPLGITYMRVRGMWGIENPWKVFDYVYQKNLNKEFNFMCIINDNKFNSLNNKNSVYQLKKQNQNIDIENIQIKNPNNPAKIVNAKLIKMWR